MRLCCTPDRGWQRGARSQDSFDSRLPDSPDSDSPTPQTAQTPPPTLNLLHCGPLHKPGALDAELPLQRRNVDVVADAIEPFQHDREVFAVLPDLGNRNLDE